jgi:hypothetical protein
VLKKSIDNSKCTILSYKVVLTLGIENKVQACMGEGERRNSEKCAGSCAFFEKSAKKVGRGRGRLGTNFAPH